MSLDISGMGFTAGFFATAGSGRAIRCAIGMEADGEDVFDGCESGGVPLFDDCERDGFFFGTIGGSFFFWTVAIVVGSSFGWSRMSSDGLLVGGPVIRACPNFLC